MAHKLREAADAFYVNADGHAKIEPLCRETSQSGLIHANPGNESKVELPSMTPESRLEHSKDYPRNKKPIRLSTPESEEKSAISSSGDVWARIGRMVQNWGVPSTMIEEHEADIAEMIVQTIKGRQNKAEKSDKADALRATHAVSETERYADITVAELAGDQNNKTVTRKLKQTLGIGPPLAKAESIRESKPVDMEIAKLDPAIIAAKKADNQIPVVPNIYSNTPAVGATMLGKRTAFERSRYSAVPEGYDKKRSGFVDYSEVGNHTVQRQQNGSVNIEGPPPTRRQGRAMEDTQIEGSKGFPHYISNPYELKDIHKQGRWKGNESGNTSVSRKGTRASNSPSGSRSSGPLKDRHGDEALLDNVTSSGGVHLGTKQVFGGKTVMDDFQRIEKDEPSREEISYGYEQSFTKHNSGRSSNKEYVFIDNGCFNMNDICIGLGEDTVDEERFDRLRMGFMRILESTLGLI